MARTKFASAIRDAVLKDIVWDAVRDDGAELIEGKVTRERGDKPISVALSYHPHPGGETGDDVVTATYDIEDSGITPRNGDGNADATRINATWRETMMRLFGGDYAKECPVEK